MEFHWTVRVSFYLHESPACRSSANWLRIWSIVLWLWSRYSRSRLFALFHSCLRISSSLFSTVSRSLCACFNCCPLHCSMVIQHVSQRHCTGFSLWTLLCKAQGGSSSHLKNILQSSHFGCGGGVMVSLPAGVLANSEGKLSLWLRGSNSDLHQHTYTHNNGRSLVIFAVVLFLEYPLSSSIPPWLIPPEVVAETVHLMAWFACLPEFLGDHIRIPIGAIKFYNRLCFICWIGIFFIDWDTSYLINHRWTPACWRSSTLYLPQ